MVALRVSIYIFTVCSIFIVHNVLSKKANIIFKFMHTPSVMLSLLNILNLDTFKMTIMLQFTFQIAL